MQTHCKIALAFLAAAWLTGCGQGKQSEEAEEKAIRKGVQSYQDAYNQQDAAKMSMHWASDATYTNPVTGESAVGREAIEKLFKQKFAQGKKKHVEIAIKSIEFPSSDQAIEKGVAKVTLENEPTQQMAYRAVYVRENNMWLVNSVNEMELQEPSSNFEHLKDLAWMVGKWEDADDNVQIVFENKWDKHKNFLTQHFKMEILGQEDFEGKQIIAWDPIKNVVRSWVFDSDGEFGEGTWEKVDKNWYATMRFTLPDGRVASSKNIYTPVDDHSYTFTSVEREVDGDILPNMDPVTVEKIE